MRERSTAHASGSSWTASSTRCARGLSASWLVSLRPNGYGPFRTQRFTSLPSWAVARSTPTPSKLPYSARRRIQTRAAQRGVHKGLELPAGYREDGLAAKRGWKGERRADEPGVRLSHRRGRLI